MRIRLSIRNHPNLDSDDHPWDYGDVLAELINILAWNVDLYLRYCISSVDNPFDWDIEDYETVAKYVAKDIIERITEAYPSINRITDNLYIPDCADYSAIVDILNDLSTYTTQLIDDLSDCVFDVIFDFFNFTCEDDVLTNVTVLYVENIASRLLITLEF